MQRRIIQIIELNELRDTAYGKVHIHQEKMKNNFDRKFKEEKFLGEDLVLKWDAPRKISMENLITCRLFLTSL